MVAAAKSVAKVASSGLRNHDLRMMGRTGAGESARARAQTKLKAWLHVPSRTGEKGCCPNLTVAPPSWRLNAGWKPALHLKLGQHPRRQNGCDVSIDCADLWKSLRQSAGQRKPTSWNVTSCQHASDYQLDSFTRYRARNTHVTRDGHLMGSPLWELRCAVSNCTTTDFLAAFAPSCVG